MTVEAYAELLSLSREQIVELVVKMRLSIYNVESPSLDLFTQL